MQRIVEDSKVDVSEEGGRAQHTKHIVQCPPDGEMENANADQSNGEKRGGKGSSVKDPTDTEANAHGKENKRKQELEDASRSHSSVELASRAVNCARN